MAELLEKIEPVIKTDLRQQISSKIIELIKTDGMVSGDLLPGERILSSKFGVSRITLCKALNLLEENGFIIVARGKHTGVR